MFLPHSSHRKIIPVITMLSSLVLLIGGMEKSHADNFDIDFTKAESPYIKNASIVGVDGWKELEKTLEDGEGDRNCVIEADPRGGDTFVLRLQREQPVAIQIAKQLEPPIMGTVQIRVNVFFSLALRDHATKTSFHTSRGIGDLNFGIDYASNGGLFYEYRPPDSLPGVKGLTKVVVLPIGDIAEYEEYELVLTLHLHEHRFDFEATGMLLDGSKLEYSAKDIDYDQRSQTLGRSLESIRLWSTAAAKNATYITTISAHPLE